VNRMIPSNLIILNAFIFTSIPVVHPINPHSNLRI
jgi:hypothetical protein